MPISPVLRARAHRTCRGVSVGLCPVATSTYVSDFFLVFIMNFHVVCVLLSRTKERGVLDMVGVALALFVASRSSDRPVSGGVGVPEGTLIGLRSLVVASDVVYEPDCAVVRRSTIF